jgi:glucoamylase
MNKVSNSSHAFINKIFENIEKSNCLPGISVASLSKEYPDYFYHWIRDSAVVMKSIVKYYELTKSPKAFKFIIGYINNEIELQGKNSLGDLGEPKYYVDRNPYQEPWGRPQNDGPALRGLTMIKIYHLFHSDYPALSKLVLNSITKDLNYVLKHYNDKCFDLWEEINGYHLYTRMVQCKFLKECLNIPLNIDYNRVLNIKDSLRALISHHDTKYTSFDENGWCCREFDCSLLLGICHIDFDTEIYDFYCDIFKDYLRDMIFYFKNEYKINRLGIQEKINANTEAEVVENKSFTWLGRYKDDVYYGGNPWVITTCAMFQLKKYFEIYNIGWKLDFLKDESLGDFFKYFEDKLETAEQLDKNTGEYIGAYNLTWNYSELFMLSIM